MYNSYSILMISLIPHFVAKGQYNARKDTTNGAGIWDVGSKVTSAIAIGCGTWFVYNLVRYFIAADSVIPAEPKKKNEKNKKKSKEADE